MLSIEINIMVFVQSAWLEILIAQECLVFILAGISGLHRGIACGCGCLCKMLNLLTWIFITNID